MRAPTALAFLVAVALPALAQTGRIVATVHDDRGRPVADAVVVAAPADGTARSAAKRQEVEILQVDREFVPRVSVVAVGTSVVFPNRDEVRHHVYSFSAAKRFELPLYLGRPSQPVVFDKPGVVVLGCNIHDWMVAYVYVAESPHFARTGSDGRAVLEALPVRSYRVRAWHPELDGDELATQVGADVARERPAEIAFTIRLKPEVRVRRAPQPHRGGGY